MVVDKTPFDFLLLRNEAIDCILNNDTNSTEKISSLFLKYHGSETDRVSAVDQAFREVLDKHLLEDLNHDDENRKTDLTHKYEELIDFVIIHTKDQFCTKNLPILLLSDIFDSLTLDDCEKMFHYVEKHVSVWTQEPFFSAGKNHLLRMCNDILRRLSKSQNTVFCGRIQLFLAQLFPVEEKSALNLMSHFNLENVTVYKKNEADFDQLQNDSMDTEDGEVVATNPVDYNLYSKFWSLQDFFRNPPKCYTKDGWTNFSTNISEILETFSSYKLEDIKRKYKSSSDSPANATEIKENVHNYFAKYLTNEKLLNLQLNDSNFRRYFLVQVLILLQYLTGENRFKNVLQTLNEPQQSWVNETQEKIYNIICETPQNGKRFCETVKHILNRDDNWITWKNEACPSFAKFKSEKDVSLKRKKRSMGEDFVLTNHKKINIGTLELSRLWNLNPDNLASAKDETRLKFLPNLDEFFEEAIEQADPSAGIEDEYKLVKQSNFQWKALRLLARRSDTFFTPSTTPFKALPEYLSNVIDNINNEIQKEKQMDIKTEPKSHLVVENGASSPTNVYVKTEPTD